MYWKDKKAKGIAVLIAMQLTGTNWIIRDEDGSLYIFNEKPDKENFDREEASYLGETEVREHLDLEMEIELFSEVRYSDEEATSIRELLLEKAAELSDSMTLKEFIEKATE